MKFIATLTEGGPLAGPLLRENYQPGESHAYGPEDAGYVESVLMPNSRFDVQVFPDDEAAVVVSDPAPGAPPEPDAPTPEAPAQATKKKKA